MKKNKKEEKGLLITKKKYYKLSSIIGAFYAAFLTIMFSQFIPAREATVSIDDYNQSFVIVCVVVFCISFILFFSYAFIIYDFQNRK